MKDVPFSVLVGKILTRIDITPEKENVYFTTNEGTVYDMYHDQDCCETVRLEDMAGDLNDLLNSPVLQSEEYRSRDSYNPALEDDDSFTWTFYRIATVKGYVTLRWLGTSNGYYSETVQLRQLDK
jgi:hypothetical protein